MAEEITPDPEVLAAALAAGDSERVARAKAKSAAVKKARKAAGVPSPAEQAAAAATAAPAAQAPPPAAAAAVATEAPAAATTAPPVIAGAPAAAAAAAPAAVPGAGAPGTVGTATLTRATPLSPAERAARVAAATAGKGGGGRGLSGEMTHRLLAMVPPEGIQRVERTQDDKVNVWPHLLLEEFVALLACLLFLTVFSTFVNAPLRELANVNLTPNPSKAPWYFLGLQELLRYFHPMIAGVLIPGIGLGILMAFPYIDKNPSIRPQNRRFAIMLFTFFMMFSAILSTIGSLFRGPGYNFVFPWQKGMFFEF
jgi:menaquinol-cytochrome c reductase cytochrome b/c subunit